MTRVARCTATGGGFAVPAESGPCGDAVSGSNGRAPTSTKPAGCAACTYEVMTTSANDYSYMPVGSISGY